ncbi:MAG: DUF192 domain-containing protein [Bryobacter sp.]|nr:DUF192 domain-containing protein [Bryobacter sp.]
MTLTENKVQVLEIRNERNGAELTNRAGIANTSELRRRGLLQHESLEEGDGLWIAPCEAVHTFAMKFPIDVLYLNKAKKVLKIRAAMPKGRVSFCLSAHSVLELPAGMAAKTDTRVGDTLAFTKR